MTVGTKLSLNVISMFCLLAAAFVLFQHSREKEFKVALLTEKLQDYNIRMNETLADSGRLVTAALDRYVRLHTIPGLRVTVVDHKGRVLYDSQYKDYTRMGNHLKRTEIRKALRRGQGIDVERMSTTLDREYFYVANYFPRQGYIIRTALPYNQDLVESLTADLRFVWFTLGIVAILSLLLYRFAHQLGRNISKLRAFAARANRNEPLETEELAEFPDDELGETAERIIKLYIQLQHTKVEQSQLKRQLIENATHELKTPVASIQGCLETILSDPYMSEDDRQQFLRRSFAQTQRLSALLEDISTLHRLDEVSVSYEFAGIDVVPIIQRIANETELQLKQRQMTFRNELPPTLTVRGNPSLLYSVFRNLTDNAIAYAGDGTFITLRVESEPDYYRFIFSDNGVGIPSEHLPRIFERFYRVDKGRSRKSGGTGLGLAIVKNAVLAHGGTITAALSRPHGLTFSFTIRKDGVPTEFGKA